MISISLRRLEVFLAIVDTGSFSRAAQQLNIAQPSVSAHMRSLEERLGGAVFERKRGSRPQLTELGRSVREHAREMLAEIDDMRAAIIKIHDNCSESLTLSCQRGLANYTMRGALTSFARARDDLQLAIRIGKNDEVVADIRDGTADLGCLLINDEIRDLTSQIIGGQRLKFIAAPDHPLALRRNVPPEEVARYGFVSPSPSTIYGRTLTRLLASIGIRDHKTVARVTEYQLQRELVLAGVGIGCSGVSEIDTDVAAGRLALIDVAAEPLVMQIRVLTSPRLPVTRPMQDLIDHLTAAAPKAEGTPKGAFPLVPCRTTRQS